MQPKIGLSIFLCIFLLAKNVESAPETCLQCDSMNEGETDCGFTSMTVGVTCTSPSACYTQIYETTDGDYSGQNTKRGCLEDSECPSGTCVSCDNENNCNGNVFPSNRTTCLKCTDNDCSTPSSQYCGIYLPGIQDCVTLFDEEGEVLMKNCYADLPDSTRELCSDSNYLDCKKCSGKDCNTEVKRDGLKCHQCTGKDCLLITTVSDLVDCRSPCYIGVNADGEPVRGCAKDFTNTHECTTDPESTDLCYICDEDYCNAIVYPEIDRLQCHTCVDGDCDPNDDNVEYCLRYHADERCVSLFDASKDEVISRGCLSTLETEQKEICEQNSTNCLKCDYSFCNKDDSKLKTDFCISCSSEDDRDCAKADSTTEKRCSTSQCFSRLIEQEDKNFGRFMERGCLADLLQATECNAPDCVSCTGKNCNNQLFPDKRISCKSCSLESCNDGGFDKICNNYIENEACVTFFGQEKEVIFRECYADAPEGTREICDDENNLSCTKCNGNLCNIVNERRGNQCYKCNGPECLKPTFPDVVDCLSGCYVGSNSKGEPMRGCAVDVANSSQCGISDMSCLTCDDDFCNVIIYPTENRRTCVKCNEQDCLDENIISEYCETLSSDEKCVTVFNDAGAVVERGCSSSIQHTTGCNLTTSSNCLKCSFDSCNIETSLDQKSHCISCSSLDDAKCVSNANATQIIGCSTGKCYTKLLEAEETGQHVQRGCRLETDSCTDCAKCSGELCNNGLYPLDRHSCYHCFGDHCAIGHLHEKFCTLYNQQNKECLTVYGSDDVVLFRDCYVDSISGTRNFCDDENNLSCTKCTGDKCNIDIKRRGVKCSKCEGIDCFNSELADTVECLTGGCYVGLNTNGETKRDCASAITDTAMCTRNETIDGTCLVCDDDYCNTISYPLKNRLICKECLGETCEEKTLEEKYCEKLSSNETCVSVFTDSDFILERGCSSTVQNSRECNASDPNCLKCQFNGCNTQGSKTELHLCVSCDSRFDPNCITASESPNTKTCTTNLCYSRLLPTANGSVWQHVEKGCVVDLKNQSSCTGSSCLACQGSRCNNILYPTDRISCLDCHKNECNEASIPSSTCQLFNRQQQACVTIFNNDNEVFYRGCYSDSAIGAQEVCDDSSQLLCTKCQTKDCNRDSVRRGKKCFKCKGIECFFPNRPADVVDCLSNSCYMGIDQNGVSVRDCVSAVTNTTSCSENDDGTNRCTVCGDDLCNGVQFPLTNRLQCHKCMDENCAASDDNLEYCERYGGQEQCVTAFSYDNKVIERSCSSSLNNQHYCDQNYANCLKCPTNGCNTVNSKVSRLCIACNSTTDANCVTNPLAITPKYCEKGCYTKLVNQVLIRGCSEDLEGTFDCIEENKCKFCNDVDKCNVENYPSNRRSCKNCNTLEGCKTPTSRLCVNYKPNDSCVTIFSGYNTARKGCLADQSSSNQLICTSTSSTTNTSSPLCTACSGSDNCNVDTVRKDENCITCSSALEPNCSQQPTVLQAQHCTVVSDGQCFTRVVNGATARGCRGLLSATEASNCRNNTVASQCAITSGQASNNKIVPMNRLKCFNCDSHSDATCSETQENSTLAMPCKKFFQPENCLKLTYKDGSVVRGCVADFSADICAEGTCQKCENISDGCNFSHAEVININSFCLMLSLIMFLFAIIESS